MKFVVPFMIPITCDQGTVPLVTVVANHHASSYRALSAVHDSHHLRPSYRALSYRGG